MAEQIIKLPDDTSNTGKKTRTAENTVGAHTVQQQVVTLADSSGNYLEQAVKGLPGVHFAQTATTGTHTATGSVSAAVSGLGSAIISVQGTYVGAFVFEVSDDAGTTWWGVPGVRLDSGVTESASGTLTNVSRAWLVSLNGATNVRFRATALSSGTANVRISPVANPATQPLANVALAGMSANNLTRGAYRNLAATVQAVKASAGVLYGLQITNNQAAVAYVQLFDTASGSVTPGTTTPVLEFRVPADSQMDPRIPAIGIPFSTAISLISATASGGGTGSASGVHVYTQAG